MRDRVRLNANRAEVRRVAIAHQVNRHVVRQKPLRAIAGETARREPELTDLETIEQHRQSAAVIGMRVRQKDRVEMPDAAIGELREESRVGRAAVDQDRVLAVFDRDRVALADIERDQLRC